MVKINDQSETVCYPHNNCPSLSQQKGLLFSLQTLFICIIRHSLLRNDLIYKIHTLAKGERAQKTNSLD